MKKRHFGLLLLILTANSSVASTHTGATIKRMTVVDNGTAIIWAENGWGDVQSGSSCASTSVVAFDSTTDAGKSLLSVAMAAMMADKTVGIGTSDTECLAVGGWAPVVTKIDLYQ